jgi:hypothetical protein
MLQHEKAIDRHRWIAEAREEREKGMERVANPLPTDTLVVVSPAILERGVRVRTPHKMTTSIELHNRFGCWP